jgi:hypothetical protein
MYKINQIQVGNIFEQNCKNIPGIAFLRKMKCLLIFKKVNISPEKQIHLIYT